MKLFPEKIKEVRTENNMTIETLAVQLGVSMRSVSYYESGSRTPSNEILEKLCSIFNKPRDFFIDTEDDIVFNATKRFGSRGKKQVEKIIQETNALFSGGELNDKDKDLFLKAMEAIYTDSKERAKKYTPKKYRNE